MEEAWHWRPKTGVILLFPSGLMHAVEPNMTPKDGYSISFNLEIRHRGHPEGDLIEHDSDEWQRENLGLVFNTDRYGKLIQ